MGNSSAFSGSPYSAVQNLPSVYSLALGVTPETDLEDLKTCET
jgi:hypothetical protein